MSVPLLFFFGIRLELSWPEWLWSCLHMLMQRKRVKLRVAPMFVCLKEFFFFFAHERISERVNARHSKVEDGADSLCAVYYRILCNYIITANHPPEVA